MLKALITTRLCSLYNSVFYKTPFKKSRNIAFRIFIGFFVLYAAASFLFMFGSFFYSICKPMVSSGFAWLYFSIAAITAITLCFVGSVFLTKAQLFDAQDNDLLMSMPIPPGYILFSRILLLLAVNYVFEFFVLVPAIVVYCINFRATAGEIVIFAAEFLLLPLIPLTLSCIFGWLLAVISERLRYKSFFITFFSLIILGFYFYFMFQVNRYLQSLIQNFSSIGEKIRNYVSPLYHFGAAVSDKNVLSLAVLLLCAIVPFTVMYAALSHNFIRIATAKNGITRVRYREQPMKVSSPGAALLKKELLRFSSTPVYILNTALGVAFILVFAAALIIYRDIPDMFINEFPQLTPYLYTILIAIICFLSSTNFISAPSISLEGKSLWILQSFPVDGSDVLLAKAKLHMVICLPAVILASLACIIAVEMSLFQILLTLLLPATFTVFCALFGVIINLQFPKFDWINETVVIKQSLSTGIAMLSFMAATAIPVLVYVFLLIKVISSELFMLICLFVYGILCLLMYRYLRTKGSAVFFFFC